MTSVSQGSRLTFPPEEELLRYLRTHSLTKDGAYERVTENLRKAVVPFFAGQSIQKASVKARVTRVVELYQYNKLEQSVLIADFTEALIDCAKGVKSWRENYSLTLATSFAAKHAFF